MPTSGSVGVRQLATFACLLAASAAAAQDAVPAGVDAVPDVPEAAPVGEADAPMRPREEPPSYMTPLLIACGALWIYLLVIRPGSRQKAERAAMMEKLKPDADVVTIGGIHGTVAKMAADGATVTIKVDGNTRLTVNRDAIRDVVTPDSGGGGDGN